MMLTDNTQRLRILIVIAHPDDESLWFFGGIKKLSILHDITIFCLTYNENSNRGKELLEATFDIPIKCFFGNLEDTGLHECIFGIQNALSSFITIHSSHVPFNLIITHPPHGGEKPHPHHLQAFHNVKQECRKRKIPFGFFSEKRLPLHHIKDHLFQLKFIELVQFNYWHLTSLIKSLFYRRSMSIEILSFIKEVLQDLLFHNNNFELHRFLVQPIEKLSTLEKYTSQIHHLLKYKTIYGSVEYLYVEAKRPIE